MSPPAPAPIATRPTAPATPTDAPAPDLDAPRPNPGEVVTLTGSAPGVALTLYSSKAGHRIVVANDLGERQPAEYPADSWASAARYFVGMLEALLSRAGSTTRGTTYCGDCGDTVHKGACPRHGEVG